MSVRNKTLILTLKTDTTEHSRLGYLNLELIKIKIDIAFWKEVLFSYLFLKPNVLISVVPDSR